MVSGCNITSVCGSSMRKFGVAVSAENGQPREVVVSIPPVWNNFVFFEVTPASFHQVRVRNELICISGVSREQVCGGALDFQ